MWSIPLIYRRKMKCVHRFVRILILGTVHSDAQIEGPPETWQVEYVACLLMGTLFTFPYLLVIGMIVLLLPMESDFQLFKQLFTIVGLVGISVACTLVSYEMRTARSKEVYKRLPAKMLPTLDLFGKRIRAVAIIEVLSIVGWVIFTVVSLFAKDG